ncbi:hypothetical protein C7M84_024661 [Penaeus vannamei]|uniref:Uncharacterized protein n=1 Tax=Penaeus vannamei TaxID=6689 RepID=A0A3R7NAX5_PENVA|nr:hypothetical protein C7M84_024661 [Penaeus vannamei]
MEHSHWLTAQGPIDGALSLADSSKTYRWSTLIGWELKDLRLSLADSPTTEGTLSLADSQGPTEEHSHWLTAQGPTDGTLSLARNTLCFVSSCLPYANDIESKDTETGPRPNPPAEGLTTMTFPPCRRVMGLLCLLLVLALEADAIDDTACDPGCQVHRFTSVGTPLTKDISRIFWWPEGDVEELSLVGEGLEVSVAIEEEQRNMWHEIEVKAEVEDDIYLSESYSVIIPSLGVNESRICTHPDCGAMGVGVKSSISSLWALQLSPQRQNIAKEDEEDLLVPEDWRRTHLLLGRGEGPVVRPQGGSEQFLDLGGGRRRWAFAWAGEVVGVGGTGRRRWAFAWAGEVVGVGGTGRRRWAFAWAGEVVVVGK